MKILTPLLYLYFIFTNATWAREVSDSQKFKVISFTAHPDYAPVTYLNKSKNTFEGIAVNKLKKAVEKMGYRLKSVYAGTWARAQEEVRKGRIDILLPPYKTDERLQWMHFQEKPFMIDESAVFVKKNSGIKFQDKKDLLNYRGVAIINDSFGNEFDKFDREKLKLTRLASTEQCFRFMLKGRADFFVGGLLAGNRVLEKMGEKKHFEALPKRLIVTGMYAGVSKKSEIFLKNPNLLKRLEGYLLE